MDQAGSFRATIRDSNVSGQVAIGTHVLQIGDINGGVVNIAPFSDRPAFKRRFAPTILRPRPFISLLDRAAETSSLQRAMRAAAPISVYGESGIGKTSLLRSLTHQADIGDYPDGIVYLSVRGEGFNDLLQSLFDAFYESSPHFKPTDAEIRHAFQNIRGLILLDDLDLTADETTALLDVAPQCMFVLASLRRSLWGEGQNLSISGLPEDESLILFERELGRSLTREEILEVKDICNALQRHPLRIIQAGSLAREGQMSLGEIRASIRSTTPDGALARASLDTLTVPQERALAILAVAGGAPITWEHIAELSQSQDILKSLQRLIALGLVQLQNHRYSLPDSLVITLGKVWDLAPWEDALLKYFASWLSTRPPDALIEQAADVLVHLIKRAGEKKQWSEVVMLGRALERVLIFLKRWQIWGEILQYILKSARALGERKTEAWALHQL